MNLETIVAVGGDMAGMAKAAAFAGLLVACAAAWAGRSLAAMADKA